MRGETRAKGLPLNNRMAMGLLAARLVDGGGKPTTVRVQENHVDGKASRHGSHQLVYLVKFARPNQGRSPTV